MCQILGEGAPLLDQSVGMSNAIDDAPRRERLWWEYRCGEHHLSGASCADARSEALCASRVRYSAGDGLNLSDLAALGRPNQVARKANLECTRVALAMDEGDRWHSHQ